MIEIKGTTGGGGGERMDGRLCNYLASARIFSLAGPRLCRGDENVNEAPPFACTSTSGPLQRTRCNMCNVWQMKMIPR